MGFPGRLNESKERPFGLYLFIVGAITALACMAWEVVKVIHAPLPPEEKEKVYVRPKPGFVEKRAGKFRDDVNQLVRGDLRRAPEKKYSGRAVTYESAPESQKGGEGAPDYYSGRTEK